MQQNKISHRDLVIKKKELENSLGMKIDSDLFKNLYLNAKFNPQINSISKNYINLKPLYLKTKGKLPKAISKMYSDLSSVKYKTENVDKKIINSLKNDGFYVIENFISNEEVDKIKSDLSSQKFIGSKNNYFNYKDLQNYERLKGNDNYFDSRFHTEMNSSPIKKESSIYSLLTNPFFENVANNYLGSKSFINFCRVIVTKAKDPKYFSDAQISAAANKFHFDYSHLRSIRFFLYLTDVSDTAGPHTFIKSSHEENFKYPKNKNDFYKTGFRKYYNGTLEGLLKDEWVEKKFSSMDLIRFTGKKGTLIIEDTTGFHKGSNCLKGSREVLLLNYALSNIGNENSKSLPLIENTKEIENNDVNYSFTEKSRKDFISNSIHGNKISIFRKIKKKILAKSKNYLI